MATTRFDVSNRCSFLSIGNSVYAYNTTSTAYNKLTLPSGWTNAAFDDTYQIAIVNNSIYQFSAGSYSIKYTTEVSKPFYTNKLIYYLPSKVVVYSWVRNATQYPFRVHSLTWNGTNWVNINISLEGVALGK